jgi:hypothetical protein
VNRVQHQFSVKRGKSLTLFMVGHDAWRYWRVTLGAVLLRLDRDGDWMNSGWHR